jgi:hypothetical protein
MAGLGAVNIDVGKVSDIVTSIGGLAGQIRSAITGDISPEAKAKLMQAAQDAEAAQDAAQSEIDKAEAVSPSLFVAGWRPAIGWVCAIGLTFQFLVRPLAQMFIGIFGGTYVIPPLEDNTLFTMAFSMLGLGTMRTVEKAKNVQGNH